MVYRHRQKDFASVKSFMHKDHRFFNPLSPSEVGPDEHIGMMTQMTNAFTGTHQLELVLEDANHVVVHGRWTGRHTGKFNGIPATQKNINFTFTDIFEFHEGKVRKEVFEMNMMTLLGQLGVIPAETN